MGFSLAEGVSLKCGCRPKNALVSATQPSYLHSMVIATQLSYSHSMLSAPSSTATSTYNHGLTYFQPTDPNDPFNMSPMSNQLPLFDFMSKNINIPPHVAPFTLGLWDALNGLDTDVGPSKISGSLG